MNMKKPAMAHKVYNERGDLMAWGAYLETLREGDVIARSGSAVFVVTDKMQTEPLEIGDLVKAFGIGVVSVQKINRVTIKVKALDGKIHTVRR